MNSVDSNRHAFPSRVAIAIRTRSAIFVPLATPTVRHEAQRPPDPGTGRSLADLSTHGVFLLVERLHFVLRDVAAILASHQALFPADLAIILVQGCGL